MAKSQTNYGTNTANTLGNQGAGLANNLTPGVESYLSGLGGAQGTQQATGNELSGILGQNSKTGGYDPSVLSGLEGETAGLAATGGFDPTQIGNTISGYNDLATTGGFTPAQGQAYVRQATEGTTDTYNTLEQQNQQSRAATGGLGSGGSTAQMARQLGQAQATNTLNAENSLNQLQTANKITGLGGSLNAQSTLASGKLAGTNEQLGLASNVAGNATTAAGQLGNLYNTQTGQVTAMGSQLLQALGISTTDQADAGNILANLSKNPGLMQTILGGLSSAGGTAAGLGEAFG